MSLSQFWPRYVLAHQKPGTRWLHLLGTLAGVVFLLGFVVTWRWWMLVGAFVVGYGFAWCGHFLVERNRPATFGHPFLSFASDLRMAFHTLTGRMETEVQRARNTLEPRSDR